MNIEIIFIIHYYIEIILYDENYKIIILLFVFSVIKSILVTYKS